MAELRRYGATTAKKLTIEFPLLDRSSGDYKSGLSFATGDVQISQDNGAFANTTSLPGEVGNGWYTLVLTTAEMSAARILVTIIDQTATKAWQDQGIIIHTIGHADALHDGT